MKFFAESYKGNHEKDKKREKEIKLRVINHEQICLSSAIDGNGNIMFVCVCKEGYDLLLIKTSYQYFYLTELNLENTI